MLNKVRQRKTNAMSSHLYMESEKNDLIEAEFNGDLQGLEKKWQPTPVFLPGESQGLRSLVDYHLRSHIELDTTEATQQQQHLFKNGYYPKTKQKDKKKKK